MSHLGMGVMINMLGGNENSVKAFKKGMEQKIKNLYLGEEDNVLHFEFENGYKMGLYDNGQSCCELRYMRTDDNLEDFIGTTLIGAEVREAPEIEDDWGNVHEVQFLLVNTDKGTFTMSSHNEHNGYYGGFWVIAMEEK